MEGLPGWVISPMPGPPPRQHKHESQYTPSTHSVIPTRRIWNDDYDGQMIFEDLVGLKFPDICLTGEEKPRKKTSPRKPVPTGDRTRARCVTSAHDILSLPMLNSESWILFLYSLKLVMAFSLPLFHSTSSFLDDFEFSRFFCEVCSQLEGTYRI